MKDEIIVYKYNKFLKFNNILLNTFTSKYVIERKRLRLDTNVQTSAQNQNTNFGLKRAFNLKSYRNTELDIRGVVWEWTYWNRKLKYEKKDTQDVYRRTNYLNEENNVSEIWMLMKRTQYKKKNKRSIQKTAESRCTIKSVRLGQWICLITLHNKGQVQGKV